MTVVPRQYGYPTLSRCPPMRVLRSNATKDDADEEVDDSAMKIKKNKRRRLAALVPNSSNVNFQCSVGRGEVCVFEISNTDLNNFDEITFGDTDASVIVMNVRGLYINVAPGAMTNLSNAPVVWHFIDALQITLSDANNAALVWLDSVVAPVAERVQIDLDTNGVIALGNPNSLLTFNGGTGGGIQTLNRPASVRIARPEPEVVICDCLCPEKKK
eukprot:Selendium_serpulae@DN5836_c0_g1_i2.p1